MNRDKKFILILCNIIAFLLNLVVVVVLVVVVGVGVGVGVGIGVGVLVAGQRGREREKEREGGREGNRWLRLAGFWRVSDWFLTLQRDSCQLDLKAKAEIPRCTSGSGGAIAAGVSNSKSSNERKDPCVNALFQTWEQNKLARSGIGPENSQ